VANHLSDDEQAQNTAAEAAMTMQLARHRMAG